MSFKFYYFVKIVYFYNDPELYEKVSATHEVFTHELAQKRSHE